MLAFIRAAEKGDRFPAMHTHKSQKWVKRPGEEGAVSSPRGGCGWADISSVERGLSFPEVALGMSFPSAPPPPPAVHAALPNSPVPS